MEESLEKVRSRALDELARAYAQDELDLSAYERLTTMAIAATTSREITRLVREVVPVRSSADPPQEFTPTNTQVRVQVLGDRYYDIEDLPGGGLSIVSVLGDATVDLSGLAPRTTVRLGLFSLLGDLKVIVPAGTRVSTKQIGVLGDVTRQSARKLKPDQRDIALEAKARMRESEGVDEYDAHPPRVVITGFKLLGDVVIIEV